MFISFLFNWKFICKGSCYKLRHFIWPRARPQNLGMILEGIWKEPGRKLKGNWKDLGMKLEGNWKELKESERNLKGTWNETERHLE